MPPPGGTIYKRSPFFVLYNFVVSFYLFYSISTEIPGRYIYGRDNETLIFEYIIYDVRVLRARLTVGGFRIQSPTAVLFYLFIIFSSSTYYFFIIFFSRPPETEHSSYRSCVSRLHIHIQYYIGNKILQKAVDSELHRWWTDRFAIYLHRFELS